MPKVLRCGDLMPGCNAVIARSPSNAKIENTSVCQICCGTEPVLSSRWSAL